MNAVQNPRILKRITLGIMKNPLRLFVSVFVAYATIWTILEPLDNLLNPWGLLPGGLTITGWTKYLIFILVSIFVGLYRIALPKSITIKQDGSIIRVGFGDLFGTQGIKAIPISRFMLETEIVATSLQGQLIHKFIRSAEGGRGLDTYIQKLSDSLQNKQHDVRTRQNTHQIEKYYPLGTTALIDINGDQYLLFAITETELKGHIPDNNCNVTNLWISLEKFWREVRVHARGKAVNIPLIGSGVTGINLSTTQLLELNLLAIVNALREGGKITIDEIRIVLHNKYIEDIDLRELKRLWK